MKIVPYNVASEKKLEFPFINVLLIRILFLRVVRYKHLKQPWSYTQHGFLGSLLRPGMASTTLRMTNCKVQTNKLPQGTVVTGRCLLIGDHCTYMSQLTSCYTGVIITCRQCMSFLTNEVIKFNHNSGGQR